MIYNSADILQRKEEVSKKLEEAKASFEHANERWNAELARDSERNFFMGAGLIAALLGGLLEELWDGTLLRIFFSFFPAAGVVDMWANKINHKFAEERFCSCRDSRYKLQSLLDMLGTMQRTLDQSVQVCPKCGSSCKPNSVSYDEKTQDQIENISALYTCPKCTYFFQKEVKIEERTKR